jgi:adenine-specific DNA-methyltransferase
MTVDEARARGIPGSYLRPILPGPKQLEGDEILADRQGYPRLSRRLVIVDCPLPEQHIRARFPAFWRYLQSGLGTVSAGYLCSRRSPWYSQESRQSTAFLCSYFARARGGRLHRFIFNHSRAIAANSYLMLYPRGALAQFIGADVARARAIWSELCRLEPESLRCAGRAYGGGLYKLEPRELARVPAAPIAALLQRLRP